LRDLFLWPRHGGLGLDHGRLHLVHHPGDDLLPDRAAPHDGRPGRRGGEGMSQDTDVRAADPVLGRLADAILIPPFPGSTAPGWMLDALGRGLAGVTLFGQNISAPGQVSALTAALRAAAAGDDPVIAIDEEGGDVTRVAYADGSPYPGNAALGAVDDT